MILLTCEQGSRKENFRMVEESRSMSQNVCYYLFEMNSKHVCSPVESKMSGGAVFCIVLLGLFLAYFVFGILYQRVVVGAKGFEQIPNFPFWRKLGNMSAEGCNFVCRRDEHPNTYKGMSDALDIDSSDDEKDDGLLPM